MTSETQNISFQVFYVIANEHNYMTKDFENNYKDLVKKYISNSYSKIEDMVNEYIKNKNSFIFAVINFDDKNDISQEWINLNLIKLNGNLFGFILNPFQGIVNEKKNHLKKFLSEMIKEKIEFIDYDNQDQSHSWIKNIEIAFSHIEMFMNLYRKDKRNLKENFQKLDFFQENHFLIKFRKLIIEQGLTDKITVKLTLKRILSSLKSILDSNNEYKLKKPEQLEMLSRILLSKNFQPRHDDKIDLLNEVIYCLSKLKDRGQEFTKETKENIEKYFEINKNKYQKDIDKINQDYLDFAIENRLEFLIHKNKLNSDEINMKEIDDFLKFFSTKNQRKKRSEFIQKLNFDELILSVAAKLQLVSLNKNKDIISKETIETIFEIGKITKNNRVALAIVQIFYYYDIDFLSIEELLENILPRISLENTDIILKLTKKFKPNGSSSLLKFLHKILIENEDTKEREEAFKILKSLKNDFSHLSYISETIELEKKFREKNPNLIQDCFEQVKRGNKLPLNCFEELEKYFHVNQISEIIREILQQDIQKLPKFFIKTFCEYTKLSTSNQENIIRISKLLILNKQIKLKDIHRHIYEHLNDDIFDLLYFQYQNGDEIPEDILKKIQINAKTNPYAKNLIKLINKTSTDIDILINSRNHLEQRKNSLEKILQDKQNYTLNTLQVLESLIKYDLDLRIEAFKALIRISSENFQINFIEIGEYIQFDETISLDDIIYLIRKYKTNENIVGFLPLLINRIKNPQISIDNMKKILNLLSKICHLKSNRKFLSDHIEYLLNLAFNKPNEEIRKTIITIIENVLNQSDQEKIKELNNLKNLENFQLNTNSLTILKENIQQGYVITEDKINLLIQSIQSEETIRLELSEILFEINLQQGLSISNINQIVSNSQLLTNANIVGILAIALGRNIQLSTEIFENLWKQFLSDDNKNDLKLKNYFVLAIEAIVNQGKSIPIDILKKIANILLDPTEMIDVKIFSSQILCKVFKQVAWNYSEIYPIIQSLKTFVLQVNDDLINKISFEILENFIEENDLDHQFLIDYYNCFQKRILNIARQRNIPQIDLKLLNDFIQTNFSNLEKFYLLCSLNNSLINQGIIDTNIFEQFPINEWRKEILCSELLASVFKLINPNDGLNEFELEKFRSLISLVNEFLIGENNPIYSIESLLQILIDKQYLYQISLELINDILFILAKSNDFETLKILQSKNNEHFFIQLRQIWLEKQLEYLKIQFTNEELVKLNESLPYRPEIIHSVLNQIHKLTKIDQLIEFFLKLYNCGLTKRSNEYFLSNEITPEITLNNLNFKLNHRLVCVLLINKYPNYAQDLDDNKYYNSTIENTESRENAYNQANTEYWYKAEDIAEISLEWMKEFEEKNIRITQALGQQNDRNLSTILTDVLNEYKQDKKSTIIPLNIAGNHWVTLGLIYLGKNIVFYKDSLGEKNCIKERKIVEEIFRKEFENVEFKFDRSCDQLDDYNCGPFTLANMKIMARNFFDRNFQNWNYVTQEEVIRLRKEEFPKMYALSLFQSYKRREIINYHSTELESIKNLFEINYFNYPITINEFRKFDNGLRLSICLPKEENLLKKSNYQYLYVIEVASMSNNSFDFHQDSKLKNDIINLLNIKEFYSIEKNMIKILDKNVTIINQYKKQKLNPDELKVKLSDSTNIQILLNQLYVQVNQSNEQILRRHLGLTKHQSIQNHNIDYQLLKKLHQKLTKILHSGWSLKSIEQIINSIDSNKKIEYLYHALDPIYEYQLREFDKSIKDKNLIDILVSSGNLTKRIHDLALFQTFQGTYNKNFQQLKDEILSIETNQKILFLQNENLTKEYDQVKTAYENQSTLCPEFGSIQKWSRSNIKKWSKKFKALSSSLNCVSIHEKIAVIMRAVEITSQFLPRDIQLLSVLILINSENNTGRLAQINTGEGKTTIVAMLAAIKALEGHRVDVVTSSPELAKPQSIQQKEFYQLFYLTVVHNGNDSIDNKERYKADIVYGAASDFQADILRDEYSKLEIRNGRKCDIAIVDEVDSMLLDGKSHIVMLSSPMPAMDHLEPLLAAIWIQIGQTASCIKEVNGQSYLIQQQDGFNDDGTIKSDLVEEALPIQGTKEEFIKNVTEKYIRKLIRDIQNLSDDEDKQIPDQYPEIKIPVHLRELITESQLLKWIDSAINAKYRCQLDQHYIFRNGKIAPVDASNTGIVQPNMHWNNGLHQFLQIKHGAKLTAEGLTTNFISNVTYFRRYSSNIYGLTGTLGSTNAQKLLSEIYHVDHVIIPPFRKKQYQELTSIITNNENDWYENIVESSLNKLENGRSVLVITKYIKEVDEIKKRLIISGYNPLKIKTYRTEDESNILSEEMKIGEIILATNIAGRGTDIRANKIEQNGGLHVLVTFLPPNERVEQQNIGRTSRTGNKGTGQFILLQKFENDYLNLKIIRDKQEEAGIYAAKTEIEKVTTKDAIFKKFCQLLANIGGNDLTKDVIIKIKLRAVEERFGIWLKLHETMANNELLKKFEETFEQEILNDQKNDSLIKNPYFHVLIGNEYLNSRKVGDAINEFTKAIKLDEYFQVNAYYNRGYARIFQYGKRSKKYKEEIKKAINDFKRAREIIEENLEPMLGIIQEASTSEALSEQILHKMTLFGVQKNTIELAIGNEYIIDATRQKLEKQKNQTNLKPEDIKAIEEQIKDFQLSKQKGIINQAIEDKQDIEIEHLEIEKSLPDDQDIQFYKDDIDEYKNNGFRGCFKIKGIKPIDWSAVISVAALGITQLVAGAAIAVFSVGAGTTIGMGLIAEGISDLIIAVKDGIINRNFSWESYGIQKAISLTVSIVCAGFGAIKDVAKTAVVGFKSIGQAMTTTVKVGWKLAARAIGTSLSKGIAKELVTQLVDYGVAKTFLPLIQEEIIKQIKKPIQSVLLANDRVRKMLELDGKNRNSYYESLIKNKAIELLSTNEHKNALKTIAIGISKGIASQKIAGLSTALKIQEVMKNLHELHNFVPNFLAKLKEEIDQIYEQENIDQKILDNQNNLNNQQQFETNTQNTVYNKQRNMTNIQTYASTYNPEISDEDIDISKGTEKEEQIKLDRNSKSPDALCDALATNLSVNMRNIIQHKLIPLVTNAGINYGMEQLSSDLDVSLQEKIGNYQAKRRIVILQNGDQDRRIPDNPHPVAEAKVEEMINELKNGGEAGLPHLGSVSNVIDRKIIVLNEQGKVQDIIGEGTSGEPVIIQYHKPTQDNPAGHWTLPGGKEAKLNHSGDNNCLFNVVGEQIGNDPNELRANTVIRMEGNRKMLTKQSFDIIRLEQYKKDALAMGGVRLSCNTIYLDDNDIDELIKIVDSENYSNRLRPNAPKDYDVIDARDDEGNRIETSKHHIIPVKELKKDLKKFIEQNKHNKSYLKRELNNFINNNNNAIGKQTFINALKLDENTEIKDMPEPVLVAGEFERIALWHTNNFRIGPSGKLRVDDPQYKKPYKIDSPILDEKTIEYLKEYEIDLPISDEQTIVCLKRYIKKKSNDSLNILRELNKLPDNVNNYRWKEVIPRMYEVDTDRSKKMGKTSQFFKKNAGENAEEVIPRMYEVDRDRSKKMGKTSQFFKKNAGENAEFNPTHSKREQNFH